MTRRLARTARAEEDLIEIWLHIGQDDPAAADRVLDRLEERSRLLAERPGLGAKREDLAVGLRHSPVGRFLILYREIPDGVEAVRYLHGARKLPELFQREG